MRKVKELFIETSCFNKARPAELIFVLLGRDVAAPAAIRAWVAERLHLGKNQDSDPQIKEALDLAGKMELESDTGEEHEPEAGQHLRTDWYKALAVSNLPAVDEALRNFTDSGSEDNAVGLVQAILDSQHHSVAAGHPTGVFLIAQERVRQVTSEGWDAAHDEEHTDGSLAVAAGCYALFDPLAGDGGSHAPVIWPWAPQWWKPKSAMRNLARAGALIAAEMDRRLAAGEKP